MYLPYGFNIDDIEGAINGVSQQRNTSYNIFVLDGAENVTYDLSPYFMGGAVTAYSEIRGRSRAAQINLANPDGMFSIEPGSINNIFWYDSRFKVEYLIYIEGYGWATIPVGVYYLESPQVNSNGDLTLNLSSKTTMLDNDMGTNLTLQSGLSLNEAVRRVVCKVNHQADGTASVPNANFTWDGSWSWVADSGAYDNGYYRGTSAGAYVSWEASTRQLTALFTKRSDAGIANIYINDALVTTVDCYAATTEYRNHLFAYEFPYGGTHSIKVERSGSKNASSSGYSIPFDGFQTSLLLLDSDIAFEDVGKTLNKRVVFLHDQKRMDCLKELVDSYSLQFYEDGAGKMRLENYRSFREQPIDWYYERGLQGILTNLQKQDTPPQYNHVVVIYGGADEAPAYRERKAEDDDPSTIFSSTGPLGDRVMVIKDNNITTSADALSRAKRELENALMITEQIDFNSVCNPLHDPYDKIHVTELGYTMVNDEYALDAFTIPLEPGQEQRFQVKRKRKVSIS